MVLLSDARIVGCCLAADFWTIAVVLKSAYGSTFSWGLGSVTALVNTVCSCRSCNYRSWEGTRVNHVISLSDQWARQLVASEWCDDPVLGWWLINGALPWWNTAIMMRSEMGWVTTRARSDCRRVKVVLPGVELLVYWKAVEGMATLISSENPRILSIQSLEAHHRLLRRPSVSDAVPMIWSVMIDIQVPSKRAFCQWRWADRSVRGMGQMIGCFFHLGFDDSVNILQLGSRRISAMNTLLID